MTQIDNPPVVAPPVRSALERCVGDTDVFAAEYWGVRPLLRRGETAHPDLADLLDIETIEQLLADTMRRPAFRIVRDGSALPAAEYTRRVRIGGQVVDDAADVDRIAAAVAGGATLVMQSLERHWAPLRSFCAELQRDLGHPVQANAYLTPPEAAGLARHHDRHEVIVVQLEGTKGWDVDAIGDVELGPGDVLYLPAGTEHEAATAHAPSLHLTFGVLTVTARDVARRLVDAAGDVLDRPLPLRFAARRDELTGAIERVRAELLAAIAAADGTAIAGDLRAVATSKCRDRERVTGRLRLALDTGVIDADTVVEHRGGATMSVRLDGGDAVIELGRCRLRLPEHTVDALRHVAGSERFRVGDLPGLDDSGAAVLVRRLVREGALATVSRSPGADRPRRGRT